MSSAGESDGLPSLAGADLPAVYETNRRTKRSCEALRIVAAGLAGYLLPRMMEVLANSRRVAATTF